MGRFADLSRSYDDDEPETAFLSVTSAFDSEVDDVRSFLEALFGVFVPKLRQSLREHERTIQKQKNDHQAETKQWEEKRREWRLKELGFVEEEKRWKKEMEETEKLRAQIAGVERLLAEEKENGLEARRQIESLEVENRKIFELRKAVEEYSGIGEEIANISRRLEEKDFSIECKNREIEELKRRLDTHAGSENGRTPTALTTMDIRATNDHSAASSRKGTTRFAHPNSNKREGASIVNAEHEDDAKSKVLVESSPSKCCPPIKRPKITIPETLGFGDDRESVRRPFPTNQKREGRRHLPQTDGISRRQPQTDGVSRRQHQTDGESRRQPQTDGVSRQQPQTDGISSSSASDHEAPFEKAQSKSSIILSSLNREICGGVDEENDDEPILHRPMRNPLSKVVVSESKIDAQNGKPTRSSLNSTTANIPAAPSHVRPGLVTETNPDDEEEVEVDSSPQIEPKKKLKSKLAAKKRRKPERVVEEEEQSSSSSLSEPWLNASTKKSSQPTDGKVKGIGGSGGGGGGSGGGDSTSDGPFSKATGSQKKPDRGPASSLTNWDPKSGKRQATMTQLLVPAKISQLQRNKERMREQEEEELRRAVEESLKTSLPLGSTTTTTTTTAVDDETKRTLPDLDTTAIDPRLLPTENVSETQALNLINDELARGSLSTSGEASVRRFSTVGGLATKSHVARPSKNGTTSPTASRPSRDEPPSRPTNAAPKTQSIESIPDVVVTQEVVTIASSSSTPVILNDDDGGFVTPGKDRVSNRRPKKQKGTPFRQLDEMFGESDDSEVSMMQDESEPTKETVEDLKEMSTSNDPSNRGKNVGDHSPPTPSSDESAFLSYSQVRREREEERLKRVAVTGAVLSLKTKKGRDELKMSDCVECGRLYLSLGHSVEATNKKIWESCPHGKGKDKEAQCGTPEHLWKLDLIERKRTVGRDEEEEENQATMKRPRRKKPLGLKRTDPD